MSFKNSSATSPLCFTARLTTPRPSSNASAIALVAREVWWADSVMCSAVLSATVCDTVPSYAFCGQLLIYLNFVDGMFSRSDPSRIQQI